MTFFPMFDVPGARLAAQLPPEPARLQSRPPLPLARSRAAHRRDAVFWPILLMYWVRPARASRRRETQLPQPCARSQSVSRTRADAQRSSAQIMLFVLTMKRQIKHMIKHRYLPFTRGKQARGVPCASFAPRL